MRCSAATRPGPSRRWPPGVPPLPAASGVSRLRRLRDRLPIAPPVRGFLLCGGDHRVISPTILPFRVMIPGFGDHSCECNRRDRPDRPGRSAHPPDTVGSPPEWEPHGDDDPKRAGASPTRGGCSGDGVEGRARPRHGAVIGDVPRSRGKYRSISKTRMNSWSDRRLCVRIRGRWTLPSGSDDTKVSPGRAR